MCPDALEEATTRRTSRGRRRHQQLAGASAQLTSKRSTCHGLKVEWETVHSPWQARAYGTVFRPTSPPPLRWQHLKSS